MLRAIKLPGNKIYTGETIEECIANAKNVGAPPMSSIAGWINEEGTFVTEKPSETVSMSDILDGPILKAIIGIEPTKEQGEVYKILRNNQIHKILTETHPMMMAQINTRPGEYHPGQLFGERMSYGISLKKRLKSLWDRIMNYKVKI